MDVLRGDGPRAGRPHAPRSTRSGPSPTAASYLKLARRRLRDRTFDNYAWTWLVVGLILIVASLLLMVRSQLARWIGYIAAGIAALSAMTWMPYYPIWAMTYVLIALLVFYALAQYGGRNA